MSDVDVMSNSAAYVTIDGRLKTGGEQYSWMYDVNGSHQTASLDQFYHLSLYTLEAPKITYVLNVLTYVLIIVSMMTIDGLLFSFRFNRTERTL
jgi:hypothetical protein